MGASGREYLSLGTHLLVQLDMPPKDAVHDHFSTRSEKKPENKCATVFKKCLFCSCELAFRNVDQLVIHLACPATGPGKSSGCAKIEEWYGGRMTWQYDVADFHSVNTCFLF